MRLLAILFVLLAPQGCIAVTAASVAGDVVEGAAKTTVFTVKTTGKVAGAVLPGGGDEEDEEDDEERREER